MSACTLDAEASTDAVAGNVMRSGKGSRVPTGAPSGACSALSATRGVSSAADRTATAKLAETGTPHVVSLAHTLTRTLPRDRSAGSAELLSRRSTRTMFPAP